MPEDESLYPADLLDDRVAIVTGASQGIGRELATALVASGARVACCARSDAIYEVADELGDRAVPVETDVTDEASVAAAVEATVERFDGVDVLVNNTGIAGPTAPVEAVDREAFERTMAVNVTGVFLTTKHAAPHLRESDHGSVINIASISGKRPLESRTPYVASKMAVIGMTRTWAFEFGDAGVTVNAVCPGATRGPRIDSVIEARAAELGVDYAEAKRRMFTDETALGELVDAADTARTVVFLASDLARHVTAQDVNVDGGTVWY